MQQMLATSTEFAASGSVKARFLLGAKTNGTATAVIRAYDASGAILARLEADQEFMPSWPVPVPPESNVEQIYVVVANGTGANTVTILYSE